jgi:hypothetical protein
VELNIPTAGCWTLGPRQALGFSRARYDYDVQDAAGEWHRDPGSDFSRVHRQQLLMQLAIQRAFSKGARSPGTIRRLVGLGIDTVAVDDALEPGDMVDLGLQFRNFAPSALQTFTLPVTDGYVGDAQILYLQEERAEPILSVFRGDGSVPAAGLATADVTVQVLNGTGTEGQGSEVTDVLTEAGFATVVADNTPDAPATTVRYAAGAEAMAHLVARYVSGPVRYEVADDLDDVDVVLVTGADWEGAVPAARPADAVPGPTTTTTTTTTTPEAPTSTTEVAPVEAVPDAPTGDPDDPFFKALPPPPGADCPVTE